MSNPYRMAKIIGIGGFFAVFFLVFKVSAASADIHTWDGGGVDDNWSTCANWNVTDTCPATGDTVTFDATSTDNCTIDASAVASITTFNLNSGYSGTITQARAFTVSGVTTIAGAGAFTGNTDNLIFTGAVNQSAGTINAGAQTITFTGAYSLTGGTFNGNAATIDHNSSFVLSGAATTYNATSGSMTIIGAWTHNATGTFNNSSGTVTFDNGGAGVTQAWDVITTETFYNLTIAVVTNDNNTMAIASGDTLAVTNTLTLTNGKFNTGTINAQSTVSYGSGFDGGTGLLSITGAGTQTITIPSGLTDIPKITINAANVTMSVDGSSDTTFSNNFTLTDGTFNQGTAKLTFSGATFSISDAFNGGSADLDIDGTITLNSGAAFVSTSANAYFSMNLTIAEGAGVNAFQHNNGTVIFDGTVAKTLNVDSTNTDADEIFNNFQINKVGANIVLNGVNGETINVAGTLTLTDGAWNAAGAILNAQGAVSVADTFNGGTGTLTVTGVGTNAMTIASGSLDLPITTINAANVTVDFTGSTSTTFTKTFTLQAGTFNQDSAPLTFSAAFSQSGGAFNGSSSAALLFSSTFTLSNGTFTSTAGTLTASSTWTHTAGGAFVHNNGAVLYNGDNASWNATTEEFYDLTINSSGFYTLTLTAGNVLTVNNDLNLTNGVVSGGGFVAKGDVTVASTFDSGTTTLTFSGSSPQTFDLTGATNLFNADITINGASTVVNLASALVMDAASQDLTITSGTFDLSGSDLTVSGTSYTFTAASGANLQLQGGETVTGTPTFSSGSTVTYDGAVGPYTMKDWTYTNATLVINGGASSVFTLGATETIKYVTITSGILSLAGNGLTVSTTFSNNGTLRWQGSGTLSLPAMDTDSGTIEFTGDGDAGADTYTVTTLSATYYNLTINSTDGATDIFQLGVALDVNSNLSITAGTFNVTASNFAITVGGNFARTGTFNPSSGTVTFDDAIKTSVISGSTTFNNFTCATQDKNIQFTAASTQTISGTFTLTGAASHLIVLRSTSGGSYWNLIAGVAQGVTYVNVMDSDASGGTLVDPGLNSYDAGHNLNWQFSPEVNWSSASQSGAESAGTFTVTATLSYSYSSDVTIPYIMTGTATGSGTDYSITTSPLVITTGNTTGNITITITNDLIDELDETVIVTIGVPTNATKGATFVHTATITDNDAAPTLAINDPSVSEGAGTGTVTATLTGGSYLGVTVDYATSSGTAISGTDFTAASGTLTWAVDETGTKTFNVTITDDTLDENDETVTNTLSNPANATISDSTGTLTITDNDDPPVVTVTSTSQSKAESAGTATVTIQLSTASGLTVTAPYTLTGTATGSSTDYSVTASPASITAGNTTAIVTFTITDDALDENSETAILTLDAPTNGTLGTDTVHTLTITDNDDPPTVAWTTASQSGAESVDTMTVTAQLSAVSGLTVTVPYTMTGTATGSGTDYSITASPVTVTAGSTTTNITITVVDDTLDENNETVIVTMGDPTNATQGATTVHTATITDNDDPPVVTVTSTSQSKAESAGTATVTIQLSTASGLTVTAPYTLTGTATGGSTDYSITASPASITAGNTTAIVTFTITDDALDENSETAILTLDAPTNGTLGTDTVHTLTITDNDDPPTVAWTASSQSGAESVGTMTVTAQLSAVSGLTVTVPYTMTGTATGSGTDYSITASPVTVTAGSTTTNITITVINDTLDENNETVIITMGDPTNATQGATTVHTATITDNDDPPVVTVTATSQSKAESAGTATVTIQLSTASGLTVTAPYTLTGTATGGSTDYSITASPASITAGNTTAIVTFTITDDALDENSETAILTLDAPTNGTLGTDTVHTLTITDNDDPPTVAWTVSSQSGAESVGTMTVTAQLSAVSGLTVTVPYTMSGTATGSGTDYSITASPVTVTAGSTTTNITITVVNDTLDENNETVIVTMGDPTNGTKGSTYVHTATTNDNDDAPTVNWTESSQSVIEDDTTITLTAELSAVSALTVTIPYTMSGTATGSGVDYSITASPVTISAGSTTTNIIITIVEEKIVEPDETVIVTMGDPTNGSQGATTIHTATIVRDDSAQTYSPTATTTGGPVSNSVSVSSPTEGEEVPHGSIKTIKWSSSGAFNFVNLYYSTDNGNTYQTIEENVVNTGSYLWFIPNEVGSTVTIKIEGTDLATVLASDTASFTIFDGVVTEEEEGDEGVEEEGEAETPSEEEVEEEINIIGMALESVLGNRWEADAEKRGIAEIFSDFPETVAIGTLVKLPDDGDLNTQFDSAVYYIGADKRRHPFPNEAVYKSWFTTFYGIKIIEAETMAEIPMGPMVTYRPGSFLVKFPSVPKVYSIDSIGALRWITSETIAFNLYGDSWAKIVQDVSEAFWSSYVFGEDLTSIEDQDWNTVMASY